ncbi:MAG: phosphate signaling complex protein PhoU [Spirochaeta sp.]|jgi:phosphate transport system protein|nr:phosphate signaling complex protein PhoU [Spirochaeta sp.]
MQSRQHFQEQLHNMYQDVLRMGTLVEEALQKALTAVTNDDRTLAESVKKNDDAIDTLQFELDKRCTELIATEQPVATDLREILVAMKIASDLERIGDHARHLVRVIDELTNETFRDTIPRFREMTEMGIGMVHDSITAYVNHDAESAKMVARRDDEIDIMHRALYKELIGIIKTYPDRAEEGTALIFLNRFLERLGDHVTNMCEWIVYAKSGEHQELNKI